MLCEVALNDKDERLSADSMLPRGLKKVRCSAVMRYLSIEGWVL